MLNIFFFLILFFVLYLVGNVYIGDTNNHRIRKVTVSTGNITTIAGNGGTGSYSGDNGPATSAALYLPRAIAIDASGNNNVIIYLAPLFLILFHHLGNVYIADEYNHRIRKITVSTGIINTIAGTGSTTYNGDNIAATSSNLNYPQGLSVDSAGNLFLKYSDIC